MNEREAFEAWAEPELYALDKREGGDIYRNVITRNAWIGWQAALASQAQQEPMKLFAYMEDIEDLRDGKDIIRLYKRKAAVLDPVEVSIFLPPAPEGGE